MKRAFSCFNYHVMYMIVHSAVSVQNSIINDKLINLFELKLPFIYIISMLQLIHKYISVIYGSGHFYYNKNRLVTST